MKNFSITSAVYVYAAATLVVSLATSSQHSQPKEISKNAYYYTCHADNVLSLDEYGYTGAIFGEGASMPNNKRTIGMNLERLNTFATYKEGWNGYGAAPIINDVLARMKGLILTLSVQPEIFPLASGEIQFEYEKKNGEYLQFKLLADGEIEIFRMDELDNTDLEIMSEVNIDRINKVVNTFYGIKDV